MNIALYGFMGAGKTSLGKALAQKMNYTFIDLDAEIEMHEAQSISEIFAQKGEIYFRKIEHKVLKDIIRKNQKSLVLSLGGGAIINPMNRTLLEIREYKNVFLDVCLETLIERLSKDKENRPLLNNIEAENFDNYITALYESRKLGYKMHAEITVHIDKEDFETSLEKLYLHLSFN